MTTMPEHVSQYRSEHRARIGERYTGWGHFTFTTLASLAVIVFALSRVETSSWLEWLAVPLSFVAANLGEYVAHRWPMHRPFRFLDLVFERHTRQHHRFFTHDAMAAETSRDFQAVLLPPTLFVFFVLFFAVPLGSLLFAFVSTSVGWLFLATAVGYFLLYEWLHFAYHQPEDSRVGRLGLIRRLRWLHRSHHDPRLMRWWNFNITFPIGDLLFGTYYRAPHVAGGEAAPAPPHDVPETDGA